MTVKQSQGHQNYNENVDPKQGNILIIMKSLKDLALMVSKKKLMLKFFSNEEICQLSPLNMCEREKKSGIFMIYFT